MVTDVNSTICLTALRIATFISGTAARFVLGPRPWWESRLVLRVQASIAKRADELRPRVARDPNLSAVGRISRSTVLKLALLRGLDVLEQEYK